MKKITLLISILLCTSMLAQAQADPFEKLMDTKGVTTVYISKAMLKMMSDMDTGKMNMEGIEMGEIARKLTSITVLTSENSEAIKAFQKLSLDIKNSKAYEPLIFTKSDEAKATIYTKVMKGEESEMVVLINESANKQSFTLVRLTGTMTLSDIQKITAAKK